MSEQMPFERQLEGLKKRMGELDEQENPVGYMRQLVADIVIVGSGLDFERREQLSFILGPIFLAKRRMKILFGVRPFEEMKSIVVGALHALIPDAPIPATPPNSQEVLRQIELQKRDLNEVAKSLVANTEFCRKMRNISPEMPNDLGQLLWEYAQFELSRSNTSLRGAMMKLEFLIYLFPLLLKEGIVSREQYELYFEME